MSAVMMIGVGHPAIGLGFEDQSVLDSGDDASVGRQRP